MGVSWPFDSTVTEDEYGHPIYSRSVSSDVIARVLSKYVRNGVFNDVTTSLKVIAATGMTVQVSVGDAIINGHHFYAEIAETLNVGSAHATLPRIDSVVARLDLASSAQEITLHIKAGTAAASPVAPALTRNSTVWELCLADLYIIAAATSIPQNRITDTRLDSARCGTAASIINDSNNLITLIAQKLGWTQLWSGAWGASGSSPITVDALADYSIIAFVMAGAINIVVKAAPMFVSFQYASSVGLVIRACNIGLSGNTLSITYAQQLAAAGSTTLTNNHISEIYGVM